MHTWATGQTNRPKLATDSQAGSANGLGVREGAEPIPALPFPEGSKPFPSVLLANIPIAPMAARDFMAFFFFQPCLRAL